MKRLPLLLSVSFFMLVLSGCQFFQNSKQGETPMERLERRSLELQAELNKVKQDNESLQSQYRSEYAALRSELNSLRSESQALRGALEQTDYSLERHIQDCKSWREKQGQGSPALNAAAADQPAGPGGADPVSVATGMNGPDQAGGGPVPDAAAATTEEGMYAAGKRLFDAGDNAGARGLFEKFLKQYPKSKQCDNAHFWIGEAYFREKSYERAILEYQKIIDQYPRGNKMPAALLKQGLAFKEIKDDINARLLLKRLVSEFPGSQEAKTAGQRLKEL